MGIIVSMSLKFKIWYIYEHEKLFGSKCIKYYILIVKDWKCYQTFTMKHNYTPIKISSLNLIKIECLNEE